MNNRTLGAIILAAGRGKRMNAVSDTNKVALALVNKPIILHIVHFMRDVLIQTVVVVVGHAKESVMEVLKDEQILFAEQTEQLGTGHAVQVALSSLPAVVTDVFVVYGDDALFYTNQNLPIMKRLFNEHLASSNAFTFLTIELDDPTGLGRIVRNQDGKLRAIVEEKDATEEEKRITEINPGCFVFRADFLREYLPKVEKSPATGEYYLTSLIDLAIKNNEHVEAVRGGKLLWRGVNTPEELEVASQLYKSAHQE